MKKTDFIGAYWDYENLQRTFETFKTFYNGNQFNDEFLRFAERFFYSNENPGYMENRLQLLQLQDLAQLQLIPYALLLQLQKRQCSKSNFN